MEAKVDVAGHEAVCDSQAHAAVVETAVARWEGMLVVIWVETEAG